jgi:alcohol dehydrogenase class IV
MLAPVLRWQAAHLSNPHYKTSQAKILATFNETLGWQEESAADAISKFVKSLGLPTRLSEVGVTSDERMRRIAERTLTDVWGGGKRQMEFEDVMAVLESAR